jgi:uracil-DNA glycosylase
MSTIYAILLPAPADLDAWRLAARRMLAAGLPPAQIEWRVAGEEPSLFGETPPEHPPSTARVPRAFIDLAAVVIRHRDATRFALLYRLLWRITHGEPELLRIPTDPDVLRAEAMAKSVRRDAHKMHAFLRFREVAQPDGPRFVAWFEPDHHIEEAEAGFFVRRFAALRFSIVTPRRSIHWDGEELAFGPGGHRGDVPAEDATEDLWRAYFAAIFNPARLKPAAMRAEMPKKYWRNMPEAADIPRLIAEAPARVREMVARGATPPTPAPQRPRLLAAESGQRAAEARPAPRDAREAALAALRARLLADATLPLAEAATQAVFGEGPVDAPLMLVGEQPGDEEDLAGRPFVGPAGRLLDAALAEARIDRARLYVTNAVKHFKYAPQGRRRLHQRPDTGDIARYRPFLLEEIALVRPRIVLAMGVTAGQALTGDARVTLSGLRGATHALRCGTPMRATVHPAYLLRLPQGEGQRRERAMFVEDLSDAAAYAGISASGR